MSAPDFLAEALAYVARGWVVFPVRDKVPLSGTHGLLDATADADQVRARWSAWPGNGIGIVCGAASGILVLDVDPRHGGDESLEQLVEQFGPLPEGPEVKTGGGGTHYYYSFPGGTVRTIHGFRDGLDLQSDRAYVVAPPSAHPSGGTYDWIVPPNGGTLPLPPPWLLAAAEERKGPTPPGSGVSTGYLGPDGKVRLGLRQDFLWREGASLRARGFDADAIRNTLLAQASTLLPLPVPGDRPYPVVVDEIVRRLGARPGGPAPVEGPESADRGSGSGLSYPELFTPKGAPLQPTFVEMLLGEDRFAALRDTGEVLIYTTKGTYAPAEPYVYARVEELHRLAGKSSGSWFRSEVLKAIGTRRYVDRALVNPPGMICFANGILNTTTLEFGPHSPDIVFTFRMEVTYDPTAVSPLWDRVLAEWQPAAPIREFLEEWIGYGLEDGYPYQYSAVNVGDGDNGKGVFLAIMGALFSGAISAETLTTLNSRFGPANLYGALVNLADELPAGEITDSAKFKAVTGGSLIRAERKGEDPFTFVNRAKMTFATNLLPKVSDRSRAFWRRVIPIRWDYIVPAETKDVHLEEKLRAELPGILNRAIAGLKRLRERGGFAAVPTVAEAAEAWRRSSDSLAYFADQMLERDPKEMVPKSALMMAYRLFCEDRELDAGKESQVGSRLPDLLPGVHAARPRIGDRQVAVWKGVRLLEAPKDASTGGFERGEQGEQGGYSSHGVEKLEGGGVGTPLTHPAQPAQAAPTPLIHPRAPSAWPPPPGTPRPIHDGCDLCPTIPAHVCPACKACLAAGATW